MTAVDTLIEANFDLIEKSVRWTARRYGFRSHLLDEMRSAAGLALVQAARRVRTDVEYPRPYLYGAMVNSIIDAVRGELGRRPGSIRSRTCSLLPETEASLVATAGDPVLRVEAEEALREILATCPNDRYREVLLRLANGESASSAATRLGVTESRVYQMVDKMRGLLAPEQRKKLELSPRQLDVLRCAAQRRTAEATALELGISLETVKRHRSHIISRLGVQRMSQAVPLLAASALASC
jgi:RNA polymerase sigma factor (sigma-70 family)